MTKKILSLLLIAIIGTYMGFTNNKPKSPLSNNTVADAYINEVKNDKPIGANKNTGLSEETTVVSVKTEAPAEQLENNTNPEKIDTNTKIKKVGDIESGNKKTDNSADSVSKSNDLDKTETNDTSQSSGATEKSDSLIIKNNANPEVSDPARAVKEPTNSDLQYIATKVFEKINTERQKKGVSNLIRKEVLNNAAKIRANEIISKFGHTRPNGKSFYTVLNEVKYGEEIISNYFFNGEEINETVYDFGSAGENITNCNHIMSWNTAIMPGFTGSENELNRVADYISTAFINSPSHYNTMVDRLYTSVGISVSYTIINPDNPDTKSIKFYCDEIFTTK